MSDRRRMLVTGATGLVGRHLVARLVEEGDIVRGMTRSPAKANALERIGCEAVVGDIRDGEAVARAAAGTQVIIHLVGILREWRDATYEAVTVKGTEAALAAARRAGAGLFIYMSALGVARGDPNPYMAAKRRAEEAVRASGLAYTIFRPSYLYGTGSPFLKLLEQLVSLPVIPVVGPGRQKMQLLWVEDLAACVVRSLTNEQARNATYELGGPEALEFNQVLDEVSRARGKRPRPKIHVPYALVVPFAAVGAKLIPTLPVTPQTLEALLRDHTCDVRYVRGTFGVDLVRFGEGLKKSLMTQ